MGIATDLQGSIVSIFKKDEKQRFFSDDGNLLRNDVYEATMSMDKDLIKLLLSDEKIKETFFEDVEGVLVFDKVKFGWTINNKQFLPDSYTRFKNKIGLTDENNQFISNNGNVVLSFPYKDCILEGGQTKEDKKRGEIFYNELLAPDEVDRLLAPKVFTNAKKYTKDGEEKITQFNDTDNFLIKGNNLLAISSLLERYTGKIKLIYIDIPYNTQRNDDSFGYNDKFNHSTWLVFMKNRLEVAKKLLNKTGILVIQCDENEQAYIKVLLDEIMQRENFVSNITVKMSEASGKKMAHVNKKITKIKECLLIYKKEQITINPEKINKSDWDDEYNKIFVNLKPEDKIFIDSINDLNIKENMNKLDSILATLDVDSVSNIMSKEGIDLSNEVLVKKWKFENSYRIFRTAASSSVKKLCEEKKHQCKQTYFSVLSKRDNLLYIVKSDYNEASSSPRVQVLFAEDNLTTYLGDIWTDISTTGLEAEGSVEFKNGKIY